MHTIFSLLEIIQEVIWGYVGVCIILTLGVYFSIKSRLMQVRAFPSILSYIKESFKREYEKHEIKPMNAFFGSLGGCVGIGNIVTICLAIKIGGPGAVFWMWVTAFFGVMLKYAEVYLGLKHRIQNKDGSYSGGPMYFLQIAYPKAKWMAYLMTSFLCVYGVEVFMFKTLQTSFAYNYHINPNIMTAILLVLILLGVKGNLNRIGMINGILIPIFIVGFLILTVWILIDHFSTLGEAFLLILKSAFCGHAALGGFVGATILKAISRGVSGACYSGDVLIGYESIMHSSASVQDIRQQANLTIMSIFLDTFVVCTCTALIIVVSGVWTQDIGESMMLQVVLEQYLPYADKIMPFFLFMLAYSTIISYFYAGLVSAEFMSPQYGRKIYYLFGIGTFIVFSFYESRYAATLMYFSGAGLMVVNSMGIFKLRKSVAFQ